MSATVVSVWRSTKRLRSLPAGLVPGTTQQALVGASAWSSVSGADEEGRPSPNPAAPAASAPAAWPCARHSPRLKPPLHEPAERSAWADGPGTKHDLLSSNLGCPPDCECRFSVGFHPPDVATRSHSSRRDPPTTDPPSTRLTSTAFTPLPPRTSTSTWPGSTSTPSAANHARQLTVSLGPDVDDGSHVDSRVDEVERGAVRAVVVREHDDPTARGYSIAVHVGRCRRREHDAGAVVVSEDQWALDGARRQDDLPRSDSPDALTRRVAVGSAPGGP